MCRSGAGLLVPGNPRLGTLRWRGRHYVCSTVDRAEQFGVEPDLYIAAVSVHISHNHGVRLNTAAVLRCGSWWRGTPCWSSS